MMNDIKSEYHRLIQKLDDLDVERSKTWEKIYILRNKCKHNNIDYCMRNMLDSFDIHKECLDCGKKFSIYERF